MTRDEAVAAIAEDTHFRQGDEDLIRRKLEEARIHLEMGKTLPWWLKEEDVPLELLAGESSIDLPTGFIRVEKVDPLYYLGPEGQRLLIPWRGWANAQQAYDGVDASGPKVAILRETSIYVFPEADADYDLVWSYYKQSAPLNAGDIADHPWLVNCPDVIIGEAGERYAAGVGDMEAAAEFTKQKMKGFSSMIGEIAERESTEGPMVMGGNN